MVFTSIKSANHLERYIYQIKFLLNIHLIQYMVIDLQPCDFVNMYSISVNNAMSNFTFKHNYSYANLNHFCKNKTCTNMTIIYVPIIVHHTIGDEIGGLGGRSPSSFYCHSIGM